MGRIPDRGVRPSDPARRRWTRRRLAYVAGMVASLFVLLIGLLNVGVAIDDLPRFHPSEWLLAFAAMTVGVLGFRRGIQGVDGELPVRRVRFSLRRRPNWSGNDD